VHNTRDLNAGNSETCYTESTIACAVDLSCTRAQCPHNTAGAYPRPAGLL